MKKRDKILFPNKARGLFLFLFLFLVCEGHAENESKSIEKLDQITQEQTQTNEQGRASQKKIEKIAEETRDLIHEYRTTLKKVETTQIYNKQLKEIIESQSKEMTKITEDIENLKETNKNILPLVTRMVETLEKFVELDVPFLGEERKSRVSQIKELLKRADVTTSEKFRRVLEAFQIENQYGKSIETYQGIQEANGQALTVDFLRIGRLILIYQTLDGSQMGLWSQKDRTWSDLDSSFRNEVRKGIQMAKKQKAPDLIQLPIAQIEVRK